MIKRYTRPAMREVWSEERKFQTWLDVELATAEARCNLGEYKPEVISILRAQAKFDVAKIEELEKTLEHDLLCFVQNVRSYINPAYQRFIHDRTTSYDTEVPAQALQLLAAGVILLQGLRRLIMALRQQATAHAWTFCMGNTHGKHAKPTTFGWRLCGHLELMEKAEQALIRVLEQLRQVKVSGAVGNYMILSPELEQEVCRILGLEVRPAATQIVGRDVFARFLSEIAIIGGNMEKMTTDFRLLTKTEILEVEEPFKKGQKGSSAMPHKRNPFLLERISGQAIALRGYASMGQELIRTWLERDIAHSSVERIALADATTLLDYMLDKMAWIIEGLVVHRDRMWSNIGITHGCWASEEAKALLEGKGYAPNDIYAFLQECAFAATNEGRQFRDVLTTTTFKPIEGLISSIVTEAELDDCFAFVRNIERGLPKAYERMGIDVSKALPSNVPEN